MRLGLFGGTFDPVHAGHVAAAREARAALGLERVLFLPTGTPPHKEGEARAPALRRFVMVELAIGGEEGLLASDHELGRQPSYTVETLEHFRDRDPGMELYLLLGMDSLAALPTWRRWRDLPRLARLVVLRRPGHRGDDVVRAAPPEVRAAIEARRILLLDNPRWDVSSTVIRASLARGQSPPPSSLDPQVLDYVRRYRLYDEDPPSHARFL